MRCEIAGCGIETTFHFTRLDSRRTVYKKYMCDDHARDFLGKFRAEKFIGSGVGSSAPGLVCVDFEMIIYHNGPEDKPVCVYLHEVGGTRRLATMIDTCAWSALLTQIEHYELPRPATHIGWTDSIRKLGGQFQDVVVDKYDEADGWFGAILRVANERRLMVVDVRPSDAYTLAAIYEAPIFVVERILEDAVAREGSVII